MSDNIPIDLSKQLLGLDHKPVKLPTTLGKSLAFALSQDTTPQKVKFMNWAFTLEKGEPIEIDETDKNTLLGFCDKTQFLTNLGAFRTTEAIDAAVEAWKKKKEKADKKK